MGDDTTRGAMPRPGAIPGLAGLGPISWPRVPRDGEGGQSGANGGDPQGGSGSGSAGSSGATPPAGGTKPAGDDNLGDAGKRALKEERDARAAAERERDEARAEAERLRNEGASEHDKALRQARKEAADEIAAKYQGMIRTAQVMGALRGAGLTNERLLAAAASDPAFASLKVTESGTVEGLTEALEAFKKDAPELFTKAPPSGSADGGPKDGDKPKAKSLEEAFAAHYQGKS